MAQIFVLGAGTPTPTPHRFGSAFAVQVGGEYLMFDCGPAATHKLVKMGIFPTQVDYLFFTHHHFDHDVDYPCFLLCRWDQSVGKEQTLQVFGPTLTQTLTERIIGEQGVFAHDWKARVNHPLSQRVFVNRGGTLPRKPPHVLAKDVGPGPVHRGREWAVSAAPAEHVQPYLDSLAYRLPSNQGSLGFTGGPPPSPPRPHGEGDRRRPANLLRRDHLRRRIAGPPRLRGRPPFSGDRFFQETRAVTASRVPNPAMRK